MNIIMKNKFGILFMCIVIAVCTYFSFNSMIESNTKVLENDKYMTTDNYQSYITINSDNSYNVKENIDVTFSNSRHGIYRYIPYMGTIVNKDKNVNNISQPYYSKMEMMHSNTKIHSIKNSNGTKCITFGDEDDTVKGKNKYEFEYKITPRLQNSYERIYFNIFPCGWRNVIPKGSKFTLNFPKDIDHDKVKFYYGKYGENKDALDLLDLSWNSTSLSGVLKEDLKIYNGLTIYAPVSEGYFSNVSIVPNELYILILGCGLISCLVLFMYFKYGIDEKVIPIVQFTPPEGMDSAAAGCIIDSSGDSKDIISLIIYLADKGYLQIEKKKKDIELIKIKELNNNAKDYVHILFNGLFPFKQNKVLLSSLKYNFADTISQAQSSLEEEYCSDLYTMSSVVNRNIALVLSVIPIELFTLLNTIYSCTFEYQVILNCIFGILYAVGILVLCNLIDMWYIIGNFKRSVSILSGAALCILGLCGICAVYLYRLKNNIAFSWKITLICVVISSFILIFCTVFMKKRAPETIKLVGYVIGFRDFIENAELDKIKYLAEENPQFFYNILPYAYVFNLSSVWIKKFESISIPEPDWCRGYNSDYSFYAFNRTLMKDLEYTKAICTSVQPSSNDNSSFGGGSSSGGCSGGGFGGGGGGSW